MDPNPFPSSKAADQLPTSNSSHSSAGRNSNSCLPPPMDSRNVLASSPTVNGDLNPKHVNNQRPPSSLSASVFHLRPTDSECSISTSPKLGVTTHRQRSIDRLRNRTNSPRDSPSSASLSNSIFHRIPCMETSPPALSRGPRGTRPRSPKLPTLSRMPRKCTSDPALRHSTKGKTSSRFPNTPAPNATFCSAPNHTTAYKSPMQLQIVQRSSSKEVKKILDQVKQACCNNSSVVVPTRECDMLAHWATDTYYRVVIHKNHGIETICKAMKVFQFHEFLQVSCCTALEQLVLLDDHKNNNPHYSTSIVALVVAAMRNHPHSIAAQSAACQALRNMKHSMFLFEPKVTTITTTALPFRKSDSTDGLATTASAPHTNVEEEILLPDLIRLLELAKNNQMTLEGHSSCSGLLKVLHDSMTASKATLTTFDSATIDTLNISSCSFLSNEGENGIVLD